MEYANNKILLIVAWVFLAAIVAPAHAVEHIVRMNAAKATFDPAYLNIQPGDTVKFVPIGKSKSVSAASVLVPAGAFNWSSIPGKTLAAKLSREGVYIYQSNKHVTKGMVGIVQVGDASNLEQVKKVKFPGQAAQAKLGTLLAQVAASSMGRQAASTTQNPVVTRAPIAVLKPATMPAQPAGDASTVQLKRGPVPTTSAADASGARADETVLEVVRVQASKEGLPGELLKAYAGGQLARGGRVGLLGAKDFLDTPFSTKNYTSEYVQNQQARTLAEVITEDSSVRRVRGSNQLYESFTLRGFQLFGNEAGFNGLYGVVPIGSVATEAIERVDLFRGPNAFLNGISPFGSIGGGINIAPKRAADTPMIRLSGDFSTDSLFGGHLDIGRRFGEQNAFGVRVNLVKREGDTAIDRQRSDTELAAIGLDFNGERIRLSADVAYQNKALYGTQGSLELADDFEPPAVPDATSNWSQSWQNQTTEETYGVVRGEFDVAKNVTAFAAIGSRQSTYGELRNYDIIENTQGDFIDEPYFGFEKSKTSAGEIGIRAQFATGSLSHQVSAAATRYQDTFAYSDYPSAGDAVPSNIFSYVERPKPDLSILPTDTKKSSESIFTSFAIADTLSAFDDKLQVTLGARQQRVVVQNFDSVTGDVVDSYNEKALTPALGVVVKPTRSMAFYANYIEGLSQGPTAPTGTVNQGQVFPPFKSKQVEAGVKFDFGRLAAMASVFQIARPNGLTDTDTNTFGINGEQRNRGIEINTFGELSDRWRILGGITFLQAKLTKTQDGQLDGKSAQGVPKVQANIGTEWDVLALKGLTLTSDVNYTSDQFTQAENNFRIPSYTVFDIGARYAIKNTIYPVILRAKLDNVFDKDYWSTAFRGLGRGGPRRLSVSATVDF